MVSLRKLSVPAVECRDFRHAWKTGTIRLEQNDGLVERSVTCLRCGTSRVDVLVRRTGELHKRSYGYVEGYRIMGQGRLAVRDIRREWLARALGKGTK